MNDFNGIVWYYDQLKKLVFKNQLDAATHFFLDEIAPGSAVLIIGGGSGELLTWLPADAAITYVEKSSNMIKRAFERRSTGIDFVHKAFEEFDRSCDYDYIICPFFLDLFKEKPLVSIVQKISEYLRVDGKLIVTDFYARGRGHQLLIWLMYRFFRLSVKVQARNLPEIDHIILRSNFQKLRSQQFIQGLVFSHIYRSV